ncbi:MAG: twin-arginine translocation signal domain-containing protein, partial [Mesorhizobium sp.]
MSISRRNVMKTALAVAAMSLIGSSLAVAATVEEIKAKGTLIVGIQGDNAP